MGQTIEPSGEDADPDDVSSNPSSARPFHDIVDTRLSRRAVLAGGMLAAAGFLAVGLGVASRSTVGPDEAGGPGRRAAGLLGYEAVPLGFGDEVVVPPGYTATPFLPWGTPILGGFPVFTPGSPDAGVPGGNTAHDQEQQLGMHHDGMHYFPIGTGRDGSSRGLLVLNHEYTDEGYLHTGTKAGPAAYTP